MLCTQYHLLCSDPYVITTTYIYILERDISVYPLCVPLLPKTRPLDTYTCGGYYIIGCLNFHCMRREQQLVQCYRYLEFQVSSSIAEVRNKPTLIVIFNSNLVILPGSIIIDLAKHPFYKNWENYKFS